MKTRFLLLALFLALLTGCAQQAPSPTPLTATATPRTPTQRLAAAIPGSYPVIIGGYAVAVLPDYYADPERGNLFLVVAYLPLKPGAPEIPSYLTEEMPQATFSDGVKTRAVSAKSAPCFFDGATTGMTVVMLAQEQVCRQKTEIKVTGFVFPLPDSFDYQLKRQVIALQLTDQYLVP